MPIHINFKESLGCYKEEVIENLLKKLSKYTGNVIEIGLYEENFDSDFVHNYKKLETVCNGHLKGRMTVKYEVKITGAGLSEEQAEFLRKKEVVVCLLMDGPEDIHEQNNAVLKRAGSYVEAMQAAKFLIKYKVDFYIGVTVTSFVAAEIHRVFSFFCNQKWNSQAYWPVICEPNQKIAIGMLPEEMYGLYLKRLFILWKDKRIKGQQVYVREFENLAGSIKGYTSLISSIGGRCPFQNLFLPNENIFSRGCMEGRKTYLCEHLEVQDLSIMKRLDVKEGCKMCRWVSLCQSEQACCRNSLSFCDINKSFYSFALPEIFGLLRNLGK